MPVTAVLDANVLYPAPLRDLLLHLATEELFQPKWSKQIQQEWTDNLLLKRPDLKKLSLIDVCKWMDIAFPDAQTPVFDLPQNPIVLPDKDDVHVLQTAINTGAKYIITFNLKDFPSDELSKYGIKALHPDAFICDLLSRNPGEAMRAFLNQVTSLRTPPKTNDEVLVALKKCQLPKTEIIIRKHLQNSL